MHCLKRFQITLIITTLICSPAVCRADMTLALNQGFVKTYKDKATITTKFHVDAHPKREHDIGEGSNDGDIHMGGRDNVILLPLVAEIVNAKMEADTKQFLLHTTKGQEVDVTGMWRIWFEHPPTGENQVQGQNVPPPEDSNPDHVFELHPLTDFAGFNCLDSFLPIIDNTSSPPKKFKAYDASIAFPYYEAREATIQKSDTAIMITSRKAVYNYVDFVMKLAGKPKDVGDGYIVPAKIFAAGDTDDPIVGINRRMIFAKGSPPADAVRDLVKGDFLHVLGIPRVNLNKVFAIASNLDDGEEYSDALPYEMIIVAILPTP